MRCVEYNTLIAMELLSFTYSVMLSNQQALFVIKMPPAAYESRRQSRVFYCLF